MVKTVHIVSLGCPKNQVDAEVMAARLQEAGFRITLRPEEARIILVNTCAFILPAKEESIGEILEMARRKQSGRCECLVVTGCLPQRYGKTLSREIPEVDLFLGLNEVPRIAVHLARLMEGKAPSPRSVIGKPAFLMDASHKRLLSSPPHMAYLKIADGCSNRCSYCAIPSIRGRFRSRPLEDLLQEAEGLAALGVRELILTAQDTTAYGRDLKGGVSLDDLMKGLSGLAAIRWIRLLYTYPASLEPKMLETIAASEKICHYIDMPVQHIDADILRAMNRRGDGRLIATAIREARRIIPDVALRTSLIVGFPGETEIRFQRLLAFVRETRFDHLGVFTYSREEGTAAASLKSRISERETERRRHVIMESQALISREINERLIGTRQEILIEEVSDDPDYSHIGRCRRQAPEIDGVTYVKGRRLAMGQFVMCTITAASTYDLYAEVAPKSGQGGSER